VRTKTAAQIADEIGQAMARNLNYNVMKEDAEVRQQELSNPPPQQEQPKK
jgi:hypothetical protein